MATYPARHVRSGTPRRRVWAAVAVALVVVLAVVGAWIWAVLSPSHSLGPSSGHFLPRTASGPLASPRPPAAAPNPHPTGLEASWVTAENERPGTTAWEIRGTPPGMIAGFANVTSAQTGQPVTLYVSTDAATYQVKAFRMGYYGGDGARLVWTSSSLPGHVQPACPVAAGTNMVSCDNWSPSLRFTVTAAFVQGDYLFKLVGSGGQQSYVPLTVTDPASHAAILIKNDVYTWQAWNPYGGYDFYTGLGSCPPDVYPPCNRARVVSFDRPYGYGHGAGDFLGQEYPLVRFAEEHGFNVTYTTDVDVEQDPAIVLQHKVILSLGHDECWSLVEREAVQSAATHGVNVVFFGASPMLRHVRLQPSPLGADREEVDYRDSAADPLDGVGNPLEVTGNTWSSPPADWSEVPFVGANYDGYLEPGEPEVPFVVADASAWIYQGTGLHNGSTLPGMLDSDFDQFDPGVSPANVEILAHSPMPLAETESQDNDPYSDMTYYTDPGGAGVFDTGTVAWIPDLEASKLVGQMTLNLLTVFGQGPAGRSHPSVPNWQQFYP
jgi:hypothetical protein